MQWRVALLVGAVSLTGCAKRPDALKREGRLDAECAGSGVAYVYPIGAPFIEQAVNSGCHAPMGAWTSDGDLPKGGVRKLAHELRMNDKLTFLCC